MTALAPILQGYFTQRLAQRQASPHTVASYRDTFSLLLRFAQQQLGTPPSRLDLTEIDAALVGAFLDHLETGRGNSIRTRNNRLAAVHSLFSYAALRCPDYAATIARVLAIPPKRTDTTTRVPQLNGAPGHAERHRRTSPACAHLGTPQTPGHTFEPCSNQRPAEMRTRRVHALNGQRSQLRSRRQAPQAADLQQEHRDSQSRMIDHGQAVSIPSGTPRFA
jgi:hypothetical protein